MLGTIGSNLIFMANMPVKTSYLSVGGGQFCSLL